MRNNLTPELILFIEESRKRDGLSEKEKKIQELMKEKEIYEAQWREVYNECFFQGIVNKEKLASIMHNLNIIDTKII
jgi:hypothetical protein